jgi:Mn-dependent DtxR family transcriptional regulator
VLGLSEAVADREACEFEHVISPESVERLAAFLEFVDQDGDSLSGEIAKFQHQYKQRQTDLQRIDK